MRILSKKEIEKLHPSVAGASPVKALEISDECPEVDGRVFIYYVKKGVRIWAYVGYEEIFCCEVYRNLPVTEDDVSVVVKAQYLYISTEKLVALINDNTPAAN